METAIIAMELGNIEFETGLFGSRVVYAEDILNYHANMTVNEFANAADEFLAGNKDVIDVSYTKIN